MPVAFESHLSGSCILRFQFFPVLGDTVSNGQASTFSLYVPSQQDSMNCATIVEENLCRSISTVFSVAFLCSVWHDHQQLELQPKHLESRSTQITIPVDDRTNAQAILVKSNILSQRCGQV